jgi:hypothetical protein
MNNVSLRGGRGLVKISMNFLQQNKLAQHTSNRIAAEVESNVDSAASRSTSVPRAMTWCRGYKATYLGVEPARCQVVGATAQTFDAIDRLLKRISCRRYDGNEIYENDYSDETV